MPTVKPSDSPALHERSGIYPIRFGGRVPKIVRTTDFVESDAAAFYPEKFGHLRLAAGREVAVFVNRFGHVAAILPGGELLGLAPEQFEVIEWHQNHTANENTKTHIEKRRPDRRRSNSNQ